MNKITTKELIDKGYSNIENMKITEAELSIQDDGSISMCLHLEGNDCGVFYGGNTCLGHSYFNEYENEYEFNAHDKSFEYVIRIMNTIGVKKFSELEGKYCRIAMKDFFGEVEIIGNIIEDRWFDTKSFFEDNK